MSVALITPQAPRTPKALNPPALVVEDGSCYVNANTYVSLPDAELYFSSELYTDNWDAADDQTKTAALIKATRLMDRGFIWEGFKTTRSQALQWPRLWCVDPDITIGYYPAITQPPNVIVGNTGGMIWPTYYPANFMPYDRLVPCQCQLALRVLGKYAQTIMLGNQPFQDPAVTDISLGQGAVVLKMTPMQAEAAGAMGLIDDEVAACVAPLGRRRYTQRGGIRKIRRAM